MNDEDEDGESAFADGPKTLVLEMPSWPQLPSVDLDHRRRVWCLMTALDCVSNMGGKSATETMRDALVAAEMIQDWIVNSKVPPKPRAIG